MPLISLSLSLPRSLSLSLSFLLVKYVQPWHAHTLCSLYEHCWTVDNKYTISQHWSDTQHNMHNTVQVMWIHHEFTTFGYIQRKRGKYNIILSRRFQNNIPREVRMRGSISRDQSRVVLTNQLLKAVKQTPHSQPGFLPSPQLQESKRRGGVAAKID